MRITSVRARRLRGAATQSRSWLQQSLIANPMSAYDRYRARRESWGPRFGPDVVVVVETDEGTTGVGGSAPAPVKPLIEQHLARLLVGEDPLNVELLWDHMWRASLPYGRKGLSLMAISAVDVALWDLVGKAFNQPLYRVLGGATKPRVPCYATGNDIELLRRLGFRGVKLAMPHGPADGAAGMRKNAELVERARLQVGPDVDIMVDCYMAWDVAYTLQMASLLEPYRVSWIEECLPPDDYDGYAEINAKIVSTRVSTGEHEYTRWGFKQLLVRRCCAVLNPDLAWCGGITEARKIAAMAGAFDVPVVPHAGGLQPWATHFIYATVNAPWAEVVVAGDRDEEEPVRSFYPHLRGWARPENGWIVPPDRAGVGVELDGEALED